jgi:hypothetical protein
MEQIEIANFDRNMELFYAIRFAREGFFSKEITLPDYMFTAIMYGYNTEWDRTHSILDFLETKDFLLRLKNELYKTPSIFLTKEPGDSTEGDDTSNNKTSETTYNTNNNSDVLYFSDIFHNILFSLEINTSTYMLQINNFFSNFYFTNYINYNTNINLNNIIKNFNTIIDYKIINYILLDSNICFSYLISNNTIENSYIIYTILYFVLYTTILFFIINIILYSNDTTFNFFLKIKNEVINNDSNYIDFKNSMFFFFIFFFNIIIMYNFISKKFFLDSLLLFFLFLNLYSIYIYFFFFLPNFFVFIQGLFLKIRLFFTTFKDFLTIFAFLSRLLLQFVRLIFCIFSTYLLQNTTEHLSFFMKQNFFVNKNDSNIDMLLTTIQYIIEILDTVNNFIVQYTNFVIFTL